MGTLDGVDGKFVRSQLNTLPRSHISHHFTTNLKQSSRLFGFCHILVKERKITC